MNYRSGILALAMVLAAISPALAAEPASRPAPAKAFDLPKLWELSAPLIRPEKGQGAPIAVKDPTVVFHDGKWHVFLTTKYPGMTPTESLSFDKWENAGTAKRTLLKTIESKYYCAPQVFYFRPHKKWYMVYQAGMKDYKRMQVVYSTTGTIADPASWTPAQTLFGGPPGAGTRSREPAARLEIPKEDKRGESAGLDFWVICDDQRAYLFFTDLKGHLWRMWTKLEDFPHGFDHVELALQADIFEAGHTYALKGLNQYLTIVEANPGGKRYFKAYLADRLDGKWTPLADTERKPFAGAANVRFAKGVEPWADNISHGELIRDSNDERLIVDPANLRFVIQGATEREKAAARGYGRIPWRIGMLTPVR